MPREFPQVSVEGDAQYPCGLALDGEVHGTLALAKTATLFVSQDAIADGMITAGNAFVEGTITGHIDCSEGAVEFTPTARGSARIVYRELSIAREAEVDAELQKVGARRG